MLTCAWAGTRTGAPARSAGARVPAPSDRRRGGPAGVPFGGIDRHGTVRPQSPACLGPALRSPPYPRWPLLSVRSAPCASQPLDDEHLSALDTIHDLLFPPYDPGLGYEPVRRKRPGAGSMAALICSPCRRAWTSPGWLLADNFSLSAAVDRAAPHLFSLLSGSDEAVGSHSCTCACSGRSGDAGAIRGWPCACLT